MQLDLLLPVLVALVFLPQLSPLVDCRTACTKCREGSVVTEILDVYCSMCAECRNQLTDQESTPERNPRLRQSLGIIKRKDVQENLRGKLFRN